MPTRRTGDRLGRATLHCIPAPRRAAPAMTKNPISPVSEPRHDDRTSRTDDEHVVDMVLLPPPEHLIRFFPIQGTPVEALVAGTRGRIRKILQGRDDRLLVVVGPCSIHDPAAALDYARRLAVERERASGDARDRDARLFREAAHDGRLEGPDQRSLARRELPHQRGPADRPPAADRHRATRRPVGQRAARHHLAAVHRRPDRLGRHRRAHDREPGAPRAGVRAARRRSASRTAPTAT